MNSHVKEGALSILWVRSNVSAWLGMYKARIDADTHNLSDVVPVQGMTDGDDLYFLGGSYCLRLLEWKLGIRLSHQHSLRAHEKVVTSLGERPS